MPKYHFTYGKEVVLAEYSGRNEPVEFLYNQDNQPLMSVGCSRGRYSGGTFIFIDYNSSDEINKLHIGEGVMRTPHAESFTLRGGGPRVDLHSLDLIFAIRRLDELKKWRDEGYRENLRDRYYRENCQYYAQPRLVQLSIPSEDLEGKIAEHEGLVETLERDNSVFVSRAARDLECWVGNLDNASGAAMEQHQKLDVKKKKGVKKIIESPLIIGVAEDVYSKLKGLLSYINARVNAYDARAYWVGVEEWGAKGEYVFIGCIPGTKEHVERYTKRHIIGSGFFDDLLNLPGNQYLAMNTI